MTAIIISLCTLLLIAYLFDISSGKTRIPSVILLLLLGWGARQVVDSAAIQIPDLNPILPALGTIGLILIVLEGALELEFNRSKMPVVRKSAWVALLPIVVLSIGLAFLFQYFSGASFKNCLINAIPISVISSSIAIPGVKNFGVTIKEFIIYESSFSDIIGVTFFNFIALNEVINGQSVGQFGLQLLLILVVSFVATAGLSWMLGRIEHSIKFAPIILLIILIYFVSKIYHLPGLIFILVFGLFLGNLDELRNIKWFNTLRLAELDKEAHRFKEITTEATFLIRSLFFLLFGFLIENHELTNIQTIVWAVAIVALVILVRALVLLLVRIPLRPYLFIAPRGLITILLFLAIAPGHQIMLVNKPLIIQVILLLALFMMFGVMFNTDEKQTGNEQSV